jgi:hypothetical protein
MNSMHIHVHAGPSITVDPVVRQQHDNDFLKWRSFITLPKGKLLTVSTDDLWEAYLCSFPSPELRQYHDCNECRRFIERFGGLVRVDDSGAVKSLVWGNAPGTSVYASVDARLRTLVESRKVQGAWLSHQRVLGVAKTGSWDHFAVTNPSPIDVRVKSADQQMAEKAEDFRVVNTALDKWSSDTMHKAVNLLTGDALYRNDKVLPQAKWLFDLRVSVNRKPKGRSNIVWRAVAEAPAGFCHPTSGMLGTLLDDIQSGMPLDEVSRRFGEKMHPLRYQRPQAAPAAQTIKQAEELFEKLGLAPALERRYLRRDEVPTFWTPRLLVATKSTTGIFASVTPRSKAAPQPQQVPGVQNITWARFERDVLPTAERMEAHVDYHDSFIGLATAVHADAPLLFQWQHPVSWWFRYGGAFARDVGIEGGTYVEVEGLARHIHEWWSSQPVGSFVPGILFVLKGARSLPSSQALNLFPECLRGELHGVRSVVEAYSKKRGITGTSNVGGVALTKGTKESRRVRVTAGGLVTTYIIDRWE